MMVGRDYHRAAGRNACNIGRLYAQIRLPGRGVRWNISIIGKQRRGFRALLFAPEMVELHVIGLAERLCSTMKKRLRGDKYSLGGDHASNLVTQAANHRLKSRGRSYALESLWYMVGRTQSSRT